MLHMLKEEQEKALAQIPKQMAVAQANNVMTQQQNTGEAPQTVNDMLDDITSGLLDSDDDELEENIKSWIEK